jgi:ferredoxin-thioredoxin reductase catalytic subunit
MAKPTSAEEYFEVLRVHSARKGLVLNPNFDVVWPLIEGLWTNKQRYGYPSCPCRLACEVLERDKDILCPCIYAAPDIEEYGQCYCGLYVHPDHVAGKRDLQHVPERRPVEKICW